MKWFPIEELVVQDREMFVAIAIDVQPFTDSCKKYTSDAYCVWRAANGEMIRWPHQFDPTHFIYLPAKEDLK